MILILKTEKIRKTAFFLMLSFLFTLFSFSAAKSIQLRLPVRVIEGQNRSFDFEIDDFKLYINNAPREIINVIHRKKSIGGNSDLGRNFILSFHMTQFREQITSGISYFVTEMLNSEDSLLILTPINGYRIKVSRNKEKMIMDIEELLKKDCNKYKKERVFTERNLENKINKMKMILADLSEDPYLIASYKAIVQFLTSYSQEFSNFKKLYLLPDIRKYQQILDLLGTREGERWWVHFQHRENNALLPKTKEIINQINTYGEWSNHPLSRAINRDLSYLEKQLLLSDSFSSTQLLDIILGGNISYNAIIWGSIKSSELNTLHDDISDLEGVLREVSNESGGKIVFINEPEQGLEEIKDYLDSYYELIYDFDGKIEEKKVQVLIDGRKTRLSYRDKFSKEEIESLIDYLSKRKVKIENFSIKESKITFSINAFKQEKYKHYGLLKVRIQLFDEENVNVYKSENIMRATKDNITISLSIPPFHHGPFKLVISVFDLIANSLTSSDHNITLE